MKVISAKYETRGRASGVVRLQVLEDFDGTAGFCGEVVSRGSGRRRLRRRREIVLKLDGNLPDYSGLMPWERELLIPVVTQVLEEVLTEAQPGGVDKDECAAREEG